VLDGGNDRLSPLKDVGLVGVEMVRIAVSVELGETIFDAGDWDVRGWEDACDGRGREGKNGEDGKLYF
jgi:hypothetical protein